MGNRWKVKQDLCVKDVSAEELIYRLLESRGIEDVQEYLSPTQRSFFDPLLIKDMDVAVKRIREAISGSEKIMIYGDYDVDGISASAILQLYFKEIGYQVSFYVPDRRKEGYGLNKEALAKIFQEGVSLIITVDCGISAMEEAEFAKNLGMDIIITDHHQCRDELPATLAVLNPHRSDCKYPYPHLCGAGLAFKLVQALSGKKAQDLKSYMEIAALATVADIVELTGENRALVKLGLKSINEEKYNVGIQSLMEVSSLRGEEITSYHIGYILAPRINSSGRIGDAGFGIKLLMASQKEEAMFYALELDRYNQQRREIEEAIVKEAFSLIEADERYEQEDVIVVAGKGWNEGVIGIVASRITERFYKPSFVLSLREDGVAKGSGRSIPAFHIFESMRKVEDVFLSFGGHSQAAGLSISSEKVHEFRRRINEVANRILSEQDRKREWMAEFVVEESQLNRKFANLIKKMEPFGMKNPKPLFILQNIMPQNLRLIGKNQAHISGEMGDLRLIGFRHADLLEKYRLRKKEGLDILFIMEENRFRENVHLQIQLKDYKFVKRGLSVEEGLRFAGLVLNASKSALPFPGVSLEDILLSNVCFVTTNPLIYEEFSVFLEYNDLRSCDLKFCPNIETIGIKGYNKVIVCDPLAEECYSAWKDYSSTPIYRLSEEERKIGRDVLLSLSAEVCSDFLERLKTNKKTFISDLTLRSMKKEKFLSLFLYLTLFERFQPLSFEYSENGIKISVGEEGEADFSGMLEELERIDHTVRKMI